MLAITVLVSPLPAQADTSAETVVRNFYTQLTATMKQGDQLGFAGRYKKLDPVVRSSFNLPFMTRAAVGLSWNDASLQEQTELVSAFSEFSVASYASRFTTYDGEQFTVLDEKPTTGGVIVETTLKPKTGDLVTLNYLMRPDDKGEYRIVDIYINGTISELATRRAEFSSIARRDGITALVNSLDQKSKEMGPS